MEILRNEVVVGTSQKNGKEYTRLDIIFQTVTGKEYRKSVFLSTLECDLLGIEDSDKKRV